MINKTANHFQPKVNLLLLAIVLLVAVVGGLAFWIFRARPLPLPETFVAVPEACESSFSVNCPQAASNVVSGVKLSGNATTANPCAKVTVEWLEMPAAGYQRRYSLYYEVLEGSSWINRTYIKTRFPGKTDGSGGSYQWQVPETLKGKTIHLTSVGYDNATGSPVCVGGAGTSSNITVSTNIAACATPPPVCTPNTRRCSGTTPQICNATGTAWTTSTNAVVCGANKYCANSTCIDYACTAGQKRCSGNTPQVCNDDRTGWVTSSNDVVCGSGKECKNNACIPTPQCSSLVTSKAKPKPGDKVTFTCNGGGAVTVLPNLFYADFKILYAPQEDSPYEIKYSQNNVSIGSGGKATYDFTLPYDILPGSYKTQCRICTKPPLPSICTEWGKAVKQ